MDKYFSWVFSVFVIASTCSCKGDAVEESSFGLLDGRYELTHAQIDGELSDRLRDLYYVFLSDTSMQTNIMGSERNFKYTFKGDEIVQHSDPEVSYAMNRDSDSTLTLTTDIRGSHFVIHLGKAKPKIEGSSN